VALLVAETILRYEAAGTPIRAVMLSRLGPNVWHETPAQAMAVLEELEETACLWAIAAIKPSPLSDAEIEELRSTFNAVTHQKALHFQRASPWVLKRLQPLKRWSHEKVKQVFTLSARTRCTHGARTPWRIAELSLE
jgi:hypothetical protein